MAQGCRIAVSCGVGCRRVLDPMWLWLWCRPAAAAPTGPLAWELPYAAGAALKRKAKKQNKTKPKKTLKIQKTKKTKNKKTQLLKISL